MGRGTAVAARARATLRSFDIRRQVSPYGNVLRNLLNVEWTGVLARDVLSQSPSAHRSVHGLMGCGTVSVPSLVEAYEPALLKTVNALLQDGHDIASPDSLLHDPIHCCSNFGWHRVAKALLVAGAQADKPGENGMLPAQVARARGWLDLAEDLEATALESHSLSAINDAVEMEGHTAQEQDQELRSDLFCPIAQIRTPKTRVEWANASLPCISAVRGATQIAEVDGARLSSEIFDRDFFRPTKPLIIRGGASAAPALLWTIADVVDAVSGSEGSNGDGRGQPVDLCSIPYPEDWLPPDLVSAARQSGGAEDAIKAGIDGPRYVFLDVEEGSALASLVSSGVDFPALLPSVLGSDSAAETLLQFSLGQSGTGAPWHWHQDAFNVCLVGERMWYFRPPALALASNQPVRNGVPEASGSFYVVQRPGDIVYVPELWGHCVVNTVLSVAVAVEFGHAK